MVVQCGQFHHLYLLKSMSQLLFINAYKVLHDCFEQIQSKAHVSLTAYLSTDIIYVTSLT